jgi:hypothetical protein
MEVIVARKLVQKIVVTYVMEDDPGTEHRFTATHGKGGQAIDGMIWDRALLDKLHYQDRGGDRYRPVDRKPGPQPDGQRNWRVTRDDGEAQAMSSGNDCVWLHDEACFWSEFCSTDPV